MRVHWAYLRLFLCACACCDWPAVVGGLIDLVSHVCSYLQLLSVGKCCGRISDLAPVVRGGQLLLGDLTPFLKWLHRPARRTYSNDD